MMDREPLSMPGPDDMDDFAPRENASAGQGAQPILRAADARRAVDAASAFPSREAAADGQLNLKGPRHVLDRFRALCKEDRRAYYDMLEILMDQYKRH